MIVIMGAWLSGFLWEKLGGVCFQRTHSPQSFESQNARNLPSGWPQSAMLKAASPCIELCRASAPGRRRDFNKIRGLSSIRKSQANKPVQNGTIKCRTRPNKQLPYPQCRTLPEHLSVTGKVLHCHSDPGFFE